MDGKAYDVSFKSSEKLPTAPAVSSFGKGSKTLLAPVAGTLLKHVVPSGSSITAGQIILIIESMKMELEIRSQVAGTVNFLVPPGNQVSAGQILAEFS